MNPRAWRDAIRDDLELDATALLVGYSLSTHLNGRGEAWPSKDTLARESRKSKRAVDGAITRLVAAGYLKVSQPSRGRKSNVYQAVIPTVQAVAGLTVQADAPLEDANPASFDTSTLQGPTPTLQAAAPESGFKAKNPPPEVEEAAGPEMKEPRKCDECGASAPVGAWPDGRSLCNDCGREKFKAGGLLIGQEMPA
jgi:hypothetical protein